MDGTYPIDWSAAGDDIRVLLTSNTYVPAAATDVFLDTQASLLTNEMANGNGYTDYGIALSSKTVTEAAGVATVDAADLTWSQNGSGFSTARYAIIYLKGASDAISPLIGYIDFGADKGIVNGDLTIQFNVLGIFTQT